jgi:protein-S-isoprenylcysteine O-methyltransferase Ste14
LNSDQQISIEREGRQWDLIQLLVFLLFLITWLLDSFLLKISTFLSNDVPLILRLALFFLFMIPAFIFGFKSHKLLFGKGGEPPDHLVETGIMARVRHPMYLAVLLAYFAFFLTTLSIACFLLFIIIAIIYDRMASFEEKQLEKMFGEAYLQYKARVWKWIPK